MVLARLRSRSSLSVGGRTLLPRFRVLLLAVLAAVRLSLPASLAAQDASNDERASNDAALTGVLTDADTDEPLAGAVVVVPALGVGTPTEADGRYALDGLPAGEVEIEVRLAGRTTVSRTVTLRSGAVNRVDMAVRPEAVEVPGLDVTVREPIPRGRMAGFHLRREEGGGVYMTREEIEEGGADQMSDLFRRLPGVRLIRHRRLPGVFHLQMSRAQRTFTGEGVQCRPRYFVDGRPFEVGNEDVNRLFEPEEVGGIEVYRGVSEIPARFNGPGARCGVVVIWTRDPDTEARQAGEGR